MDNLTPQKPDAQKRGPGRPTVAPDEQRTRRVYIGLTKAEKRTLLQRATDAQINLAAFIRRALGLT